MSLTQHHAACYEAFQKLCGLSAKRELPDLSDQFDKYKLWAGNVGAAHSGSTYKLSLDYRLREASFYRDQVVKLLAILQRHIDKATKLVKGERTSFEDLPSDERPEHLDSPPCSADIADAEAEDSPWEISSDSGSEVSLYRTHRRRLPAQTTPDQRGSENFEDCLADGNPELFQTVESIKLTVASLFKLPIRRPAPIDRLNDKSTEETSYFQPFDVLYVRDKFPGLDEQLAVRLGKMITRRRQLLLYRKRHRQKLRTDVTAPTVALPPREERWKRTDGQSTMSSGGDTERTSLSTIRQDIDDDKSRITSGSGATTLNINGTAPLDLEHLMASSFMEIASETSIVASEKTRKLSLEVPPRPRTPCGSILDRFECQYCHLTPLVRSERAWRKHVLSDLQPFVCTFVDCSLSDHLFEGRDAWYEHEIQHHRVEFFCNTTGHSACPKQVDFENHMRVDHGEDLRSKSPALLRMFIRPSRLSEETCNLCFNTTKALKSHVGRHLEQISLFAIPRADYSEEDDNSSGDSNVAENQEREVRSEDVNDNDSQTSYTTSEGTDGSEHHQEISTEQRSPRSIAERGDLEYELIADNMDVPDAEETAWDAVTNKFFYARNGLSEAAPADLTQAELAPRSEEGGDLTTTSQTTLSDSEASRPTPRTRFRDAIKAVMALKRLRRVNRAVGIYHNAHPLIIDAGAELSSQQSKLTHVEELRALFAQRFAGFWPLVSVVQKDKNVLQYDLIKRSLEDFLKLPIEPDASRVLFLIGAPQAAVETADKSGPETPRIRSLAEVLFKCACRTIRGKDSKVMVFLDAGNPWAPPSDNPQPLYKICDNGAADFDEDKPAEWNFPVLVAGRPDANAEAPAPVPYTGLLVRETIRLIDKNRTFTTQHMIDAMNAKGLPNGARVILLGPGRDHMNHATQFTPRTQRTAGLNLQSVCSVHTTVLLINVACTVWLLVWRRRQLRQLPPALQHAATAKDQTSVGGVGGGGSASALKNDVENPLLALGIRDKQLASRALERWKLVAQIRGLEKRLLETRVLFLWRANTASAPTTPVAASPAAKMTDRRGKRKAKGPVERAAGLPTTKGNRSSSSAGARETHEGVDFGTKAAEQAVASLVEMGFSPMEAEFALAHTSGKDGRVSVERAAEFLSGFS